MSHPFKSIHSEFLRFKGLMKDIQCSLRFKWFLRFKGLRPDIQFSLRFKGLRPDIQSS